MSMQPLLVTPKYYIKFHEISFLLCIVNLQIKSIGKYNKSGFGNIQEFGRNGLSGVFGFPLSPAGFFSLCTDVDGAFSSILCENCESCKTTSVIDGYNICMEDSWLRRLRGC